MQFRSLKSILRSTRNATRSRSAPRPSRLGVHVRRPPPWPRPAELSVLDDGDAMLSGRRDGRDSLQGPATALRTRAATISSSWRRTSRPRRRPPTTHNATRTFCNSLRIWGWRCRERRWTPCRSTPSPSTTIASPSRRLAIASVAADPGRHQRTLNATPALALRAGIPIPPFSVILPRPCASGSVASPSLWTPAPSGQAMRCTSEGRRIIGS